MDNAPVPAAAGDDLAPWPFACFWDAEPERFVPLYPAVPGRLPRPEQAVHVRVLPVLASRARVWHVTVNDSHAIELECPREALQAALDALAPALAPWTVRDAGPDAVPVFRDGAAPARPPAVRAYSFYARVHRRPPEFAERPLLAAHIRAAAADDDVYDVSHVCAWALPLAPSASFVWAAACMPWDPAPLYDAFGATLPADRAARACPACRASPAARWRDPATQTEFCPGFVELRAVRGDPGRVVAFYRPCGAAADAPMLSETEALMAFHGNGVADPEAQPTHTASGNRLGAGPAPYDSASYVLGRWSGTTYDLDAQQSALAGAAPRVRDPAAAAPFGRHIAGAPFVAAFLDHAAYYIARYVVDPTPQLVRDLLRAQRHWEHTAASSRVSAALKRVPTDLAPMLAAAAGVPPRRYAPLPRAVVALHARLSAAMTTHRRRQCAHNPRAAAGGRPHAPTTLAYAHALLWLAPPHDTPLSTPRYGKSDRPCRESRARVKTTLDAAARAVLARSPYARMPLPVYEPFPDVAMAVFSPAPGSEPVDLALLDSVVGPSPMEHDA